MKKVFLAMILFTCGQLSAQVINNNIDPKKIKPDASGKTVIDIGALKYIDDKDNISSGGGRPFSEEEKKAFDELSIPSIISGTTTLAKAEFKNLSVGIDDDVLSFSTGLRKQSENKPAKVGLTLKAKAPDGTKPVLSGGKFSSQFSAGFRFTFADKTKKWFLVDNTTKKITENLSSVHNHWINITASFGVDNLVLFTSDSATETRSPFSGEVLISYNTAFHSLYIKRYIRQRNIFSIAGGLGRYNNYTSLDEQTLKEGISSAEGNRFLETKSTTGRKGDFKNGFGIILRSALYIPLSKPISLHAIYTGLNLNSFGIFTSRHVLNGQAGLYWSKRKMEDSEDKKSKVLKEEFSIGLIMNMKGLDNINRKSFFTEIAEVGISAQIPLGF